MNPDHCSATCDEAPAKDTCCAGCPEAQPVNLQDVLDLFSADDLPVLYLSGPMTGHEDFNFPRFNRTALLLRHLGFPVLNPADFGSGGGRTWNDCLGRDLLVLSQADLIVLLPDWFTSKGASVEHDAAIGLGKPCVPLGVFQSKVVEPLLGQARTQALLALFDARDDLAVLIDAAGEIRVDHHDVLAFMKRVDSVLTNMLTEDDD